MAVFQFKKTGTSERMQKKAQQAGKQLSARSKYLGHLAAAQGYRAAAGARETADKTSHYVRRNPMASMGILAAIASLIGYFLFRRAKR